MSALGQKRAFAPQKAMSALPPKADMCVATAYVCFGPIADIDKRPRHLVPEYANLPPMAQSYKQFVDQALDFWLRRGAVLVICKSPS
jgi:hypothetical protein